MVRGTDRPTQTNPKTKANMRILSLLLVSLILATCVSDASEVSHEQKNQVVESFQVFFSPHSYVNEKVETPRIIACVNSAMEERERERDDGFIMK